MIQRLLSDFLQPLDTSAFVDTSNPVLTMTPNIQSAFATAQGGLTFNATPGANVELIVDNRYLQTLGSSVSGYSDAASGLFQGGETVILRPVIDGVYGPDYVLVVNGAAQSLPSSTAMAVTVLPQQSSVAPSLSPVPTQSFFPSSKPGRSLSPLVVVAAAIALYMMLD